jgi:hypothetical protein
MYFTSGKIYTEVVVNRKTAVSALLGIFSVGVRFTAKTAASTSDECPYPTQF